MVEPNDTVGMIWRAEKPVEVSRLLRHGTTMTLDDEYRRIRQVAEDSVAYSTARWQ